MRSKCLLISWFQSPSIVICQPKKIKLVTVSIFSPSICHEVMGPDAMILVFWMLSLKPTFLLSSFMFFKRFFSSSSLSAIKVVSFPYLEKEMSTHSSTLAWKIPWTEEPGRLQSMGSQRVGHTEWLHFHFSLSCIREGNGNPLHYSCLENPRDRGAWWAAVYAVAQSQTWLKQLSSSSISISETSDVSPSNLDSRMWFIQPGILHDVICILIE